MAGVFYIQFWWLSKVLLHSVFTQLTLPRYDSLRDCPHLKPLILALEARAQLQWANPALPRWRTVSQGWMSTPNRLTWDLLALLASKNHKTLSWSVSCSRIQRFRDRIETSIASYTHNVAGLYTMRAAHPSPAEVLILGCPAAA